MQRLTHFIQGHQRVILELKQPDVQKSLIQALKELAQKRPAVAAAVSSTSRIHDHRNDVAQGVQRQLHTGWKCHSSGGSRFGAAYEPWSDDMACILQGSCLPGSTRYCRTLSMFTKMELNDIMQATQRNGYSDGKRHYHTSTSAATCMLPVWSVNSREATPHTTSLLSMTQYSTDNAQGKDEPEADQGQVSQRQRLKMAVRDYGSTVVVFHVCISLMSLGGFYLAVSSGIDVQSLLSTLGFSADVIESKLATGTSTFVMAYAVHKVFAPVRIAITLTCTPFIVRYLRGIGLLKRAIPTK